MFIDMNSTGFFDFTQPWWCQNLLEELKVDGKLYVTTGDLARTLWDNIYVIFFNKTMVKDYGIENPYDLVNQNKWTLGKLEEICRTVTKDIDGDGVYTRADLFGYSTETGNLVDVLQAAFDMPVVIKDGDGNLKVNLGSEKMASIVQKLYSFLYENPGVYAQKESVMYAANPMIDEFSQDRVMFLPDCLGNSKVLRSMETDFGIVPLPKWDESQAKYQTWSQNGYSIFGIPIDVKSPEMSSIITEALCVESYRSVIPAYYEVTLKTKFARDAESAKMMDLARDGLIFNFGYVFSNYIDGMPALQLRFLMSDKKKDITSVYEKNAEKYQKSLDKLLEQIQLLP